MKTEHQLARTELELRAIDYTYAEMRRLDFRPPHDTWKRYCREVSYKLADALMVAEYREKNR